MLFFFKVQVPKQLYLGCLIVKVILGKPNFGQNICSALEQEFQRTFRDLPRRNSGGFPGSPKNSGGFPVSPKTFDAEKKTEIFFKTFIFRLYVLKISLHEHSC